MRRACFIFLGGLVAAATAHTCIYLSGTAAHRSVGSSDQPALAWLRQEYQLTDAQYARVRDLHEAYQAKCMEMCRKIDAKNAQLHKLLAATNVVTPEINRALAESAQLRVECQGAMLQHFYEISQGMSPEQGKRYLTWVQTETLVPSRMPPTQPAASPRHPP